MKRNGRQEKQGTLSRRKFLKVLGLSVAGTMAAAGCRERTTPDDHILNPSTGVSIDDVPVPLQYPEVPYAPGTPPSPNILRYFTPEEADLVVAITARLLPGTPDDPGAREAGVVTYIDNKLAFNDGFNEPIYHNPPFAESYEGDDPPNEDRYQIIWIPEEDIERYGFQSRYAPRDVWRIGLGAVNRFAQQEFDDDFVNLDEDEQDEIIEAMVENEATGFEPLTPLAFFHVLRRNTMEGMFSDPAYGGNRGMVGWKLVGFPGAQRSYNPIEFREEGLAELIEPWSLNDLPHFYEGDYEGIPQYDDLPGHTP
jgi:gluconate 2-dehydrogenase gamma chain